jgi:hypothetical protein
LRIEVQTNGRRSKRVVERIGKGTVIDLNRNIICISSGRTHIYGIAAIDFPQFIAQRIGIKGIRYSKISIDRLITGG